MEISFKHLRVKSFIGYNIKKISDDIQSFFTDPDHSDYELVWIDNVALSWSRNQISIDADPCTCNYPQDLWQAVTLVYKEG